MNRKEKYSESNRAKTQYKITRIPIKKGLDKSLQESALRPSSYVDKIEVINFSSKLLQKKGKDLFTNSIFGIGKIRNKSKAFSNSNITESDFLFFDFEETKNGILEGKKVLNYDKCMEILSHHNLNHILKTSYNHSDNNPRLHLFLPLLTPIKDALHYSYNWQETYNTYFAEYDIDISVKNISRWCFSSRSETIKSSVEFTKNDVEVLKLNKEQEKLLTKNMNSNNGKFTPSIILDDKVAQFHSQAKSMFGMTLGKYDSNGILKFYRDSNDRTPNVWYPTSYSSGMDKYTIMDKKTAHRVLFSYEDFQEAKNANAEREHIQRQLESSVKDWFVDGGKKYVVTNEGLGKSSTILKLGKTHNFIFVCHSNTRITEVSKYLLDHNIHYEHIRSNSDILREYDLLDILQKYEAKMDGKRTVSFRKLIDNNIEDITIKNEVIARYEENLNKLQTDNCVRLITSNKLKYEIYKENYQGEDSNKWYTYQQIIFDEFNYNEWAGWKAPEDDDASLAFQTIWNKPNAYIQLTRNEFSFMDLLQFSPNVLLLTTERGLIQTLFYKSEYSEIRVFDLNVDCFMMSGIPELKFEQKLFDDSVSYVLTNTTKSGEVRDALISTVDNAVTEDLHIISNNSKLRHSSHLAVKGKNDLTKTNTLVVGTLRTEVEDNIVYYSSKSFFDEYQKTHTAREVNQYIKEIHLQAQVSQSIGRNSGFRNQGAKTIVILPIVSPNSQRMFNPLKLNYISPNVQIYLFKEESEACA